MSEQLKPCPLKNFLAVVLAAYHNAPDDQVLSVGHWQHFESDPSRLTILKLPEFHAKVAIKVGEIRFWNARAQSPEVAALVKAARAFSKFHDQIGCEDDDCPNCDVGRLDAALAPFKEER